MSIYVYICAYIHLPKTTASLCRKWVFIANLVSNQLGFESFSGTEAPLARDALRGTGSGSKLHAFVDPYLVVNYPLTIRGMNHQVEYLLILFFIVMNGFFRVYSMCLKSSYMMLYVCCLLQ